MKNTENAQQKLDNLETLAHSLKEKREFVGITCDEDGYYIIGNKMFVSYKAALRYIDSISN
jgi:hypothetical protein